MTPELLPCPFCGGEAADWSHSSCDCCGKAFTGVVRCSQCDAEVNHHDTAEDAARAWNRRVPLSPTVLAEFDDPTAQTVYEILCDTTPAPEGQHWEGWLARRIAAAIREARND